MPCHSVYFMTAELPANKRPLTPKALSKVLDSRAYVLIGGTEENFLVSPGQNVPKNSSPIRPKKGILLGGK